MILLLDAPIEQGEQIHSTTTSDNKIWGPFDSKNSSTEWSNFYEKNKKNIFLVKELYEGSISGEEYSLISKDALDFGTHPLIEINDIYDKADNGEVVVSTFSKDISLNGNTAVLVNSPTIENKYRNLPEPLKHPLKMDINNYIEELIPSKHKGEIIIFTDKEYKILIGWRLDKRHTKDIDILSRHDILKMAHQKAQYLANHYQSDKKNKIKKNKDYQKNKVYSWERSLNLEFIEFKDIKECKELSEQICRDIGIPKTELFEGQKNLEMKSYFQRSKGIVIASNMKEKSTVIHETAHYIVSRIKKINEPSHGPVFAGILSALYSKYSDIDIETILKKADDAKIDIDKKATTKIIEMIEQNTINFKP